MQKIIQNADIARFYGPIADKAPGVLSKALVDRIEDGKKYSAVEYNTALDIREALNAGLTEIFGRFDAILTPASAGPAPNGLESTGNAIFNRLWTYLGVPCVTVPLLEADGLPMGVQLVGARHDDGRVLRNSRWLDEHLSADGHEPPSSG
jgi:Asp-tRNA(Asn)/Glu-tRNA(Gln) amidotransferase A subunit family amidase